MLRRRLSARRRRAHPRRELPPRRPRPDPPSRPGTQDLRPGERRLTSPAARARRPSSSPASSASRSTGRPRRADRGDRQRQAAATRPRRDGRFHLGDAERHPPPRRLGRRGVLRVRLCTFPDKASAAAEMARVLRPGGRVGITDVALDPHRLDAELQSLAGWVACIADARPVSDYRSLEQAGARRHAHGGTRRRARQDGRPDRRPPRRLRRDRLPALEGIDFDAVRRTVAAAARAVRDGVAGYSLLVGCKPAT